MTIKNGGIIFFKKRSLATLLRMQWFGNKYIADVAASHDKYIKALSGIEGDLPTSILQ